jgi:hypothetical protein
MMSLEQLVGYLVIFLDVPLTSRRSKILSSPTLDFPSRIAPSSKRPVTIALQATS